MSSIWFVFSAVKVLPCFKTQILASCSKFRRQSGAVQQELTFESMITQLFFHLSSRQLIINFASLGEHQSLWYANNFMLNAHMHLIYSVEVLLRGKKIILITDLPWHLPSASSYGATNMLAHCVRSSEAEFIAESSSQQLHPPNTSGETWQVSP